jgi:hypothetical protein
MKKSSYLSRGGNNKIRAVFSVLSAVCFTVLFTSCPLNPFSAYSTEAVTAGTIVSNYPEWCTGISAEKAGLDCDFLCYGYSPWFDWQSETGKKLHDFVNNNIATDEYTGKFRILLLSQYVYICFNDRDSANAIFFNYYGDYFTDGEGVSVPQSSADRFEYDAWFRRAHRGSEGLGFDESCTDSNRSKVVMTKISDTSFRYTLAVAGEKIIDTDMTNYTAAVGEADLGISDDDVKTKYWWIPNCFDVVDGRDSIHFSCKDGKISLGRPLRNTLYSFEGISLRKIDEEDMTVSFNLLDADQSDFADYVEFSVTGVTKELLNENDSCLRNHGSVTFYKMTDGQAQVVRTYDPEKTEFIWGYLVNER